MRKFAIVLLLALVFTSVTAFAQEDERIVVEFWYGGWQLDFIEAEIEPAFEEMFPQYDLVSRTFENYAQLWENYILAREQGELPALFQGTETLTQVLRDSGYFKSVAGAIGDRTEINGLPFNFDDFVPAIGNYYSVDGEFYSMPWNTSAPILYANMELLVEAGIAEDLDDMDAMARTWQEIEEHCVIILEALEDVDCSYWRIDTWYLENSLAMAGEFMINNENGRVARADEVIFTSEAAIELFEWWRRMLDEGYFIQYGANPGTAPEADFASGRVVYWAAASSASINRLNMALAENGYTMGTNLLPWNAEWDYGSIGMGGATIYLSDGLAPEVEEAALTFLAFNVLPENDAAYHLEFGYIPVRLSSRDILEAQGWPLVFQAPVKQFDAANLSNAVGPLLPTFLETRVIINDAMTEILLNGAPIEETLAEAEADATAMLQEYNLLVVGE